MGDTPMVTGSVWTIFAIVSWVLWIIQILAYLWSSIGLFLINKKLWEDYPWLSFIPIVSIYSFVKAWWKDWIWVLWLILGFLFIIPWIILYGMICAWISKRTWWGFWRGAWIFFFPYIVLPIVWNMLKANEKELVEVL